MKADRVHMTERFDSGWYKRTFGTGLEELAYVA